MFMSCSFEAFLYCCGSFSLFYLAGEDPRKDAFVGFPPKFKEDRLR